MFSMSAGLGRALSLIAVLSCLVVGGSPGEPRATAWDDLLVAQPSLVSQITPSEQRVLQRLSPEQLESWLGGVEARHIVLDTGETLAAVLLREGIDVFDLSWWSLDGGGGVSMGGTFEVRGSLGQVDPGFSSGGGFRLKGGFWAVLPPPPDPCESAGTLFCSGFESGELTAWSTVVGGP